MTILERVEENRQQQIRNMGGSPLRRQSWLGAQGAAAEAATTQATATEAAATETVAMEAATTQKEQCGQRQKQILRVRCLVAAEG